MNPPSPAVAHMRGCPTVKDHDVSTYLLSLYRPDYWRILDLWTDMEQVASPMGALLEWPYEAKNQLYYQKQGMAAVREGARRPGAGSPSLHHSSDYSQQKKTSLGCPVSGDETQNLVPDSHFIHIAV